MQVTDGSSPYFPFLSMKITKVHQTESQIAAKNWNQPQYNAYSLTHKDVHSLFKLKNTYVDHQNLDLRP